MENYYSIVELKNILLKKYKVGSDDRERLKKSLQMSNLLEIHLEEKIELGLTATRILIPESIIQKSFEKNKISLNLPKDLSHKATSTKIYKEPYEFYKDLNKKRKGKKAENRELSREEKKATKAKKAEIRKKDRRIGSFSTIESYKELINNNEIGLLFDIECNERKQSQILEIGYIKFNKLGEIEKRHLIIKEFENVRNGRFVEDNKDNYDYGISEKKSLKESLEIIKKEIEESGFIIGHGIANDISFLRKNKVEVPKDHKVLDSLKMTRILNDSATKMSIKNGLLNVGIEPKNLHNAGNDACLNYLLIKEIIRSYDLKKLLTEKINNVNNSKESLIKSKPVRKIKI